jgi:hypothetical protein
MQLSRNTSTGKSKKFFIVMILVFIVAISAVMFLGKIDLPSPSKEIEKIISNEKLKIVK